MKKLLTLLGLVFYLLTPSQSSAQSYLTEDFSTFNDSILPPLASGWKNVDSTSPPNGQIWRFDNPSNLTINSPMTGKVATLDSDFYGPGVSQDAYLTSPGFSTLGDSTIILEFDHFFRNLGTNIADVEVFDGTQWVIAQSFAGNTTANPNHEIIDISTIAANKATVQVRFHYVGSFAWWWILDNINIYKPLADDLAMISVDSLTSGCSLDSIPVKATVVNVGTTTITSFAMNYLVNGTGQVTENVITNMLPGDTLRYTFTKQANVSAIGSYTIDVFSSSRNDANNVNDSASGTVQHLISNNVFPYNEGFELGNGGWISGGNNNSWQLGAPAGTIINSASGGTQAWVTNLTGAYNNSETSFVTSPCFDFSSLTQPQIKMNIWIETENGWDGVILQSSIDGGLTWQQVGALNDPVNWYNGNANAMNGVNGTGVCWTGNSPLAPGNWILAERDLTGLAGQPSVRLRVTLATDGSVTEEGFAFDNVLIQDAPANDAGVAEIVRPLSGCGLTTADSIEVRIFNPGSTNISNFGINASLNSAAPITETFTGTILPGDTVNYVFAATLNLGTVGSYNLEVYTSLAGDGNATNDTISETVENIPLISSFPYNEGFEMGNGGWLSGGINNSWQLGAPAGFVINSAAGGTQAWVTNLSGAYNNNELSFVESPCFDFTSLAAPQIKLNIWVENESGWDGTILQSSVNGGQTWQTVGALNNPGNWYNANANAINAITGSGPCWTGSSPFPPGSWVLAEQDLIGLGGQPAVRLRLLHATDGSVTLEGFGFDNILIQDAPSADAAVVALNAPLSGCGLTSTDTVKVLLTNAGSAAIDTLPLAYSINAGPFYFDTSFTTINPGDTVIFAFDTAHDFSVSGPYNIFLQSFLNNDGNTVNDSASANINSDPTVSFPYFEDFETSNGSWTTGGTNSSWSWGNPLGAYIPSAGSGSNAWVTNLAGPYNNNEFSYLESPCIDLSGQSVDPILSFQHIFETENNFDEGWVEVSNNGGLSWSRILTTPTAINWYNDSLNQFWDDTSNGGSGIWVNAENQLTGTAGQSGVKIRFIMSSDGSVTREGFGVDSISIDVITSLQEEIQTNLSFNVFPNPSKGQFILQNGNERNNYEVTIIDPKGKVVFDQAISFHANEQRLIDLSGHAKGLYLMRINSNESSYTERIIIQ